MSSAMTTVGLANADSIAVAAIRVSASALA